MSDIDFERALAFDLDHEGRAYEDVPGDPGGPTKAGITHTDFENFLKEHGQPVPSDPTAVRNMTDAQMRAIYLEHYWHPLHGADLPWPVDIVMFDSGVNVGIGRAVKWLQGVLGVAQDGQIGPNTMAAMGVYVEKHGAVALASAVLSRRTQYYHDLVMARPVLGKFLKGWLSRCADLAGQVHSPV